MGITKMITDLEALIKRLETIDIHIWNLQRRIMGLKRRKRNAKTESDIRFIEGKIEAIQEIAKELCKVYQIEYREPDEYVTPKVDE